MRLDGIFEISVVIKEGTIWEDELRFILIQAHYAQSVYGVPFSQVSVGVCCLEPVQDPVKSTILLNVSRFF